MLIRAILKNTWPGDESGIYIKNKLIFIYGSRDSRNRDTHA